MITMSGTSDSSKYSATRPLHFVNSNAASLGAEDIGKRTRDVKSHLSGHYRRWKKQQTLGTQAAKNERRRSTDSTNDTASASSDLNELGKSMFSPTSEHDSEPSSDEAAFMEDIIREHSLKATAEAVTLQNVLTYGNSDPFGALPLPVDPKTNMHIQLFHEGTTVSCWTTDVDPRLKHLLQFEPLMHGVLAISKIIAAIYLPGHKNSAVLIPESRQHYGELLRLMRIYFEQRTEVNQDLEIEMIHAATMFSFLSREYEEFEFHLKSLKSLIDSFGGLQAICPAHKSRFLNAERLRGLFLLKKPLIPLEEWEPGPWSEVEKFRPFDPLYERGRSMMSSASLPLLPPGPFSQDIQILIIDHRDMLAAGSVAATLYRTKKPGAETIIHWLGLRSHALTIRTAETLCDITKVKQSQPSLELSLLTSACLAANFAGHLVHFSMNPTVGLSYVPFPNLTQTLREVAKHIGTGTRLQYQDLYLWTLFIGACAELASRTWSCDPGFRGSTWCSTNLAYMIETLGIGDVREFKANLRQFLFPFMFDSYLKVLFESRHQLIKLSITNIDF